MRKIPSDTWKALEQSLILTPSSYGLQPWKFYVVKDRGLRERLLPNSWNQAQITDASHLVVFAQKKDLTIVDIDHYVDRIAEVRNVPGASINGFKQMMMGLVGHAEEWAGRQVYIALGNFLTSAALLGIDACPMEGINVEQYDQILGVGKENYHTLCVAAAGYRASDDSYAHLPKVRFPVQEIITHL